MNPENLLQFIPFLKDLFINKDNQVEKKSPKLIQLEKRVKKHFKKPGSGKADWAKYHQAAQLLRMAHSGQESFKKYGMQRFQDGRWKTFDAIDFIEAGKKGGKGTFLGKKMIYPEIAKLLTDENYTDEQLTKAFTAYKSLIENPEAAKEAPSFRVPQELLAEWGKEYAPVMKEFFEKEYPKGEYTSVENVIDRIALGDRPGGVTVNLDTGAEASYQSKMASYKQPDFASAFPISGEHAVYQTSPDATDRNLTLRRKERTLLGDLVTSSVSEESSRNRLGLPLGPANINLATYPHASPLFKKLTERGQAPARMINTLEEMLAHEFGHSSPLFTQKRGPFDLDTGRFKGQKAHQRPFEKLLQGSYDVKTKTRTPGALDLRGEGGRQSIENILEAYLESPEYKAQIAHPTFQFENFMRNLRISAFKNRDEKQ